MSEQAYKTPLVDMLRNVPKDHRTEWPIQWAENGAETGHALCPIGKLAHEVADRIAELEAAQAQAPERKCSECGNGEPDLSLYCVRCLNNDHWHLIDPAQASDPVAVADKGVINWIDGKQFDHEADLYTQPAVNQQLLEALLEHFVGARFAIDTNMKGTAMDCINEGIAAIAAAQEQNNSATAQENNK